MLDPVKLYIGGEWCDGSEGDSLPVLNPATGETITNVAMASQTDMERALSAADAGFHTWKKMAVTERADLIRKVGSLLRQRKTEIARTLTMEQGKTLGQASWEVSATADYFDDLAATSIRLFGRVIPNEGNGVDRVVVHEPIGPVFAVAPWNLPAMMPGRKIANSLAAGCSVIIKAAKETPATAAVVVKCCEDAGIPRGVVNLVSGPSSLLSQTMISSDVIRKVSFTGSTNVGKELAAMAGAHMKRVTMELGGHAPVIVCEDVDMEQVISASVQARYSNAGQSCMAPTRFFIHKDRHDEFLALFVEKVSALKLGNGLENDVQMGPLASARRVPEMASLVADATKKGATLCTGGKAPDMPGFFFEPTVLSNVPDTARIMTEEPFGPITPVVPYSDLDDVIDRANGTPYGIASYVFTKDLSRASHIAGALEAGLVGINSMNVAGPSVPFGGVRDSGVGREGSLEGLLESMVTKTISTASATP